MFKRAVGPDMRMQVHPGGRERKGVTEGKGAYGKGIRAN